MQYVIVKSSIKTVLLVPLLLFQNSTNLKITIMIIIELVGAIEAIQTRTHARTHTQTHTCAKYCCLSHKDIGSALFFGVPIGSAYSGPLSLSLAKISVIAGI